MKISIYKYKLIFIILFSLIINISNAQETFTFKRSYKSLKLKKLSINSKSSYNFKINNLSPDNIILIIKTKKHKEIHFHRLSDNKLIKPNSNPRETIKYGF